MKYPVVWSNGISKYHTANYKDVMLYVTNYETFSEAWVKKRPKPDRPTSFYEKTFRGQDRLSRAKKWCENKAKKLT